MEESLVCIRNRYNVITTYGCTNPRYEASRYLPMPLRTTSIVIALMCQQELSVTLGSKLVRNAPPRGDIYSEFESKPTTGMGRWVRGQTLASVFHITPSIVHDSQKRLSMRLYRHGNQVMIWSVCQNMEMTNNWDCIHTCNYLVSLSTFYYN